MVELRIHNKLVDLYPDESITITSQIKDPQHFEKVFTDFSQSFTVPASNNNNDIFHHYYRFNVIHGTSDNFIDFRLKQRASLDVNGSRFRDGHIKLNSMNMEMDHISSYSVTFFGSLAALKDIFGERVLSDLDFSDYNHPRDATNVTLGLNHTGVILSNDIIYPLISKRFRWTAAYLSTAGDPRNVEPEGFSPAIRVNRVLDVIAAQIWEVPLTFNSNFFQEDHFESLYLLCNRELSEDEAKIVSPTGIPISFSGTITGEYIHKITSYPLGTINMDEYTLSSDKLATMHFYCQPGAGFNYTITMYVNDVLRTTQTNSGNQLVSFTYLKPADSSTEIIRWYISSDTQMNMTINSTGGGNDTFMEFQSQQNAWRDVINGIEFNEVIGPIEYSINDSIPNLKIVDFFTGILKMFNLTVDNYDASGKFLQSTFFIEPYDDWKALGKKTDISKFVDISSHTVTTSFLPRQLSFKYQDPEAFLNARFKINTSGAYGDGSLNTRGSDELYEVEFPFENLLWERQTDDAALHIGWLTSDAPVELLNPLAEPLITTEIEDRAYLLYWDDTQGSETCDISLSGSATTITSYKFCNTYYPRVNPTHSLNFGSERNSYYIDDVEEVSLYSLYHVTYISSIFSLYFRYHQFKATLNSAQIFDLQLKDTVQINDIWYHINKIVANLNTNEVVLSLVNVVRALGTLPPPADTTPPTIGHLSIVPNPETDPPVLGLLFADTVTTTTASMWWDSATDASGVASYQIYKDNVQINQVVGTQTTFTAKGLTPGTSYEFKITATDTLGNVSGFSNIITMVTNL